MIIDMVNDLTLQQSHQEDVQGAVLRLARESLGTNEVSANDDFLRINGASIAIASLTLQIEEHFDIEFPLVRMFEFRTLADLSAEVQKILDSRE